VKKKIVGFVAGALLGTLGAAAPVVAPVIATDVLLQKTAEDSQNQKSFEAFLVDTINSDPKFVALVPKLELTERWVATDTAGALQKELDQAPWPQADMYRHLNGTKNAVATLRERDEADARIVANKTHAKFRALMDARKICRAVESGTPAQVTATKKEIIVTDAVNLPVYLEYCGGDAASYKDALSPLVKQSEASTSDTKLEDQSKDS
jgi:hypothetical protein